MYVKCLAKIELNAEQRGPNGEPRYSGTVIDPTPGAWFAFTPENGAAVPQGVAKVDGVMSLVKYIDKKGRPASFLKVVGTAVAASLTTK